MAFSAILAVFLAASAVLNFWFVSRGKVVNAVIFLFAVILFIPPEAVGLISGSPYSDKKITYQNNKFNSAYCFGLLHRNHTYEALC